MLLQLHLRVRGSLPRVRHVRLLRWRRLLVLLRRRGGLGLRVRMVTRVHGVLLRAVCCMLLLHGLHVALVRWRGRPAVGLAALAFVSQQGASSGLGGAQMLPAAMLTRRPVRFPPPPAPPGGVLRPHPIAAVGTAALQQAHLLRVVRLVLVQAVPASQEEAAGSQCS